MIGLIVLYNVAPGIQYPAIVTNVVAPPGTGAPIVNLQVFLDGPNATAHGFSADDVAQGLSWKGTVASGEQPGSWTFCRTDLHTGEDGGFSVEDICEVTEVSIAAFNAALAGGATREAALDSAVGAAVDHGQVIDLRDGTDNELESPSAYRVYADFVVSHYEERIAAGDDHASALASACQAVVALSQNEGDSGLVPARHGEGADAYEARTNRPWPWPENVDFLWFENERGTGDVPTGNGCIVPGDFDFVNCPPAPWSPCSL
jgi:hypothetical protein